MKSAIYYETNRMRLMWHRLTQSCNGIVIILWLYGISANNGVSVIPLMSHAMYLPATPEHHLFFLTHDPTPLPG